MVKFFGSRNGFANLLSAIKKRVRCGIYIVFVSKFAISDDLGSGARLIAKNAWVSTCTQRLQEDGCTNKSDHKNFESLCAHSEAHGKESCNQIYNFFLRSVSNIRCF